MTLTKQQHGTVIKNLGYLKWSMFSLNTTTKLIRKPELQKQHYICNFCLGGNGEGKACLSFSLCFSPMFKQGNHFQGTAIT